MSDTISIEITGRRGVMADGYALVESDGWDKARADVEIIGVDRWTIYLRVVSVVGGVKYVGDMAPGHVYRLDSEGRVRLGEPWSRTASVSMEHIADRLVPTWLTPAAVECVRLYPRLIGSLRYATDPDGPSRELRIVPA